MTKIKLAAIVSACVIAVLVAVILIISLTHTLTVSVSPLGAGWVYPSGGNYKSGSDVTLTANPASDYVFDHWSGDASGTSSDVTITMDADKSVIASFKPAGSQPPPNRTLTVHFIDVGQGDSILLDLGDIEVLIDGGGKSQVVASYISDYVDGPLEVMIATHPHADHIGGLITVLNAFEVGEIWLNGDTSTSQTYSQFMSAVNSEGADVFVARSGDTIQAGDLILKVLHPVDLSGSTNDNSIVLSLSYGQIDFLLTGDAERVAEARMLALGIVPDVEILKVGHHGSRTASSAQFLQLVKPECAIYMAGQGNSYGHPHQETLTALAQVGAEVFGTDTCGTIVVTTDGRLFSVVPEKQCARSPPEPARFDVSDLSISPREAKAGESVTISAQVTNTGSRSSSYAAVLRINGSPVETRTVILNAGQSQVVRFSVIRESAGTYRVEVDGLAGAFTVSPVVSPCMCYSYTLKRYIPCEQATAICIDGTCSISQTRSGTCSHHGGVARWTDG